MKGAFIAGALMAILVSGCSTIKMSTADRQAINKVRISEAVKTPDDIFYWDRAQSLSVGLGAGLGVAAGGSGKTQGAAIGVGTGAGVLVGQQLAKTPKENIKEVMKANGIDIGELFKGSFKNAVEASGKFAVIDKAEDADATIDAVVNVYGFGQTQGFSSTLYPIINVTVAMTSKDGRVVWRHSDYVTPHNKENSKGHTYEEYVATPDYIRDAFQKVSSVLSGLLIEAIPSK